MNDKDKERIQLNLRLDGHRDLYDAVKEAAAKQGTSVNSFVLNSLKAALGWREEQSPSSFTALPLEAILEALAPRLDSILEEKVNRKLEERLGELAA